MCSFDRSLVMMNYYPWSIIYDLLSALCVPLGQRSTAAFESHRSVQGWSRTEASQCIQCKFEYCEKRLSNISSSISHLLYILFFSQWTEFMMLGEDVPEEELDALIKNQSPNECCTLIYTSGTTGNPKGVMLSHDNVRILRPIQTRSWFKTSLLYSLLSLYHFCRIHYQLAQDRERTAKCCSGVSIFTVTLRYLMLDNGERKHNVV